MVVFRFHYNKEFIYEMYWTSILCHAWRNSVPQTFEHPPVVCWLMWLLHCSKDVCLTSFCMFRNLFENSCFVYWKGFDEFARSDSFVLIQWDLLDRDYIMEWFLQFIHVNYYSINVDWSLNSIISSIIT
jgi:hypothetical protein